MPNQGSPFHEPPPPPVGDLAPLPSDSRKSGLWVSIHETSAKARLMEALTGWVKGWKGVIVLLGAAGTIASTGVWFAGCQADRVVKAAVGVALADSTKRHAETHTVIDAKQAECERERKKLADDMVQLKIDSAHTKGLVEQIHLMLLSGQFTGRPAPRHR